MKTLILAAGIAPMISSLVFSEETPEAEMIVEEMREEFPLFDVVRGSVSQTGSMSLDGNPGDLSVRTYGMRAILSRPIDLFSGINMIPFFNYELTELNFGGTGAIPIGDEDLHSVSLQALFFKNFQNTPWLAVGWTRAEFASDYQGIGSDDFSFDLSLGLGYKFNDSFTFGLGFVVTDLNGRERFFPGINFDWKPNEKFRMGIYGPNLFARYIFSESWFMSVDGAPSGGVWNINDDFGVSRNVQLDSYLLGLYTHHKISKRFWLTVGGGYTFANQIEIRDNGPSFSNDMDGAPFFQVALSLREW
ncbi:MAG: DUF6268 family outer membrane beta-barrel protein [Akkermansiaceae bacterium]